MTISIFNLSDLPHILELLINNCWRHSSCSTPRQVNTSPTLGPILAAHILDKGILPCIFIDLAKAFATIDPVLVSAQTSIYDYDYYFLNM